MAVATSRIRHEERLSTVGHLSELRARMIVSVAAIAVAFSFCMWQNHALLHIINRPLERQTLKQERAGNGPLGAAYLAQQGTLTLARQLQKATLALSQAGSGVSPATRRALSAITPGVNRSIQTLSRPAQGDRPVTLGIGEPFTTTVTIALIFALILSLPVVLYQLYAFLIPAVSPERQRLAAPVMAAVPLLFVVGVVFGYLVVLPAAVRFFQNFNSSQFNILVQASQYYHFAAITLLAMGLVFEVPLAIVALTRAGVISTARLRRNRRYAILACGVVAALLPSDAITMLLETVPLYLLFEAGLLVSSTLDWRARRRLAREADPVAAPMA